MLSKWIKLFAMLITMFSGVGQTFGEYPEDYPGFVVEAFSPPSADITGLAYDGKLIWVADWKEDRIYGIDGKTGKQQGTIDSPGPVPTGLAWDGSHLWVVDLHFKRAYRIDVETKTVVWEIPLPGSYPYGLAFDGKFLFLADRSLKKILKISPTDGAIFHEIDSPGGITTGLAYGMGYLWVSNRIDDEIYMVDPESGSVINVYKSPGAYPWGNGFDGRYLLSADYVDGKIYRLRIRPQGGKKWIRYNEKSYKLEFFLDAYNFGPSNVDGGQMVVAIARDRENQIILAHPIYEPYPDDFFTGSIGQKYAIWKIDRIKPPSRKTVVVKWAVSLFDVDWFIFPEEVDANAGSIPRKVRETYLRDGEKYLIRDKFIKDTVKEIVKGEKSFYWKVRKIYRYVIDRLSYKLAGGWETAPKVLKRGSGSCSEYTFSFISLCRAAGIPARYVGSIVVRRDDASVDDVFHRWAEVYLPPYGWVPVDANHGDKSEPRGKASGFGHLTNNLFVTTVEGLPSDNKLGWNYDYDAHFVYKGQANTYVEGMGYWRPLRQKNKGENKMGIDWEEATDEVCR